MPVGADNARIAWDLRILADQAAEPGASSAANVVAGGRDAGSAIGWFLAEGPVRPVGVVAIGVFAEARYRSRWPGLSRVNRLVNGSDSRKPNRTCTPSPRHPQFLQQLTKIAVGRWASDSPRGPGASATTWRHDGLVTRAGQHRQGNAQPGQLARPHWP